jgi:hypothetical protein
MSDDGPILEPVARRGLPTLWVCGFAVVLVAVIAIAIGGRAAPGPSADASGNGEAAVASASGPAASMSLAPAAPAGSRLSSPAPIWYRPSPWPMGEDGLAGGTAYSSPSPSPDPGDFSPMR